MRDSGTTNAFHPGESLRGLVGRLEVEVAVESPFTRDRLLRLWVAGDEFGHTAIAGWVAVEAD